MEFLTLVKAAILGIVEGLTEFLPISSTGHLIVASSLLNFTGEKVATFEIAIQTGAMFAVIWEYRVKLMATLAGAFRERIARAIRIECRHCVCAGSGIRTGVVGGLIKAQLFHPVPVALAFVIGGLIILWAERRHHRALRRARSAGRRHFFARVESVDDMCALDALKVGLVQCAGADSWH